MRGRLSDPQGTVVPLTYNENLEFDIGPIGYSFGANTPSVGRSHRSAPQVARPSYPVHRSRVRAAWPKLPRTSRCRSLPYPKQSPAWRMPFACVCSIARGAGWRAHQLCARAAQAWARRVRRAEAGDKRYRVSGRPDSRGSSGRVVRTVHRRFVAGSHRRPGPSLSPHRGCV